MMVVGWWTGDTGTTGHVFSYLYSVSDVLTAPPSPAQSSTLLLVITQCITMGTRFLSPSLCLEMFTDLILVKTGAKLLPSVLCLLWLLLCSGKKSVESGYRQSPPCTGCWQ